MGTTNLAQKLYDKSRLDAQAWRKNLGEWVTKSAESGFLYSGSTEDILWSMAREQLMQTIPEYFDWIDKEARDVSPTNLRRESVQQCIGAVISYSRKMRSMTITMHQRLANLEREIDHGNWEGIDDGAIAARGDALLRSLSLDKKRSVPSRLNQLMMDHPWFFSALAVISLIISLASFTITILKG